MATCYCGEQLDERGDCWQGKISGGHQGNCVICGDNALLDGLRCCSAECGRIAEVRDAEMEILNDDEIPF
jgi:hypothetical protein